MGPAGVRRCGWWNGEVGHLAQVRGRADRLAVVVDDGEVHDVVLGSDPDVAGHVTATIDATAVPLLVTVLDEQVWASVHGRTLRLLHPSATYHANAAAMAGAGALAS